MLPRVVIHNVVSVDGRIDWIRPDVGLYYELAARWPAEAILTGSETLLSAGEGGDEPADGTEAEVAEPTAPDPADQRPLLVATDSRGRFRNWDSLRKQPYWRDVLVLCSRATPRDYLDYLARRRVEHFVAGGERVDLRAALAELATRYGVKLVRVDSGGTLNGALLRAGLVDEISVLIHPNLVGGTSPQSLYRAADLASPDGVIPLRLTHVEQLRGEVVWLRYEVVR